MRCTMARCWQRSDPPRPKGHGRLQRHRSRGRPMTREYHEAFDETIDLPDVPFDGKQPKSRTPRFKLIRFNQVQRSTAPPYLVGGLIPVGGLIVIWGPPKCGKSFW